MNITTLNEYHDLAMRTSNPLEKRLDKFDNAVMRLCIESWELSNIWKQQRSQGHQFDPAKILDKLGDILQHTTQAADAFGYSLAEVARGNIQKLQSERSINTKENERPKVHHCSNDDCLICGDYDA